MSAPYSTKYFIIYIWPYITEHANALFLFWMLISAPFSTKYFVIVKCPFFIACVKNVTLPTPI
jgi:hypothetical protein